MGGQVRTDKQVGRPIISFQLNEIVGWVDTNRDPSFFLFL